LYPGAEPHSCKSPAVVENADIPESKYASASIRYQFSTQRWDLEHSPELVSAEGERKLVSKVSASKLRQMDVYEKDKYLRSLKKRD
jgi:hypothetical protein